MKLDWKAEKEQFVSGLSGGSIIEVAFVIGVLPPVSMLLARASRQIQISSSNFSLLFFLRDWSTAVLPMLLIFTAFSEHAISYAIFIAFFAFFFGTIHQTFARKRWLPLQTMIYNPVLTEIRALLTLATALSIIAVDFNIFPRRFAKTELRGVSVMDAGVGVYVFCSGLSQGASIKSKMKFPWKSFIVLTFLGFTRLVAVKFSGYPEHVGEYGIHWNFFFTLAITTAFSFPNSTDKDSLNLDAIFAIICIALHQLLLTFGEIGDWVIEKQIKHIPLIPEAWLDFIPQTFLWIIESNKEGIFSLGGYISLVLFGKAFGKLLFRERLPAKAGMIISLVFSIACFIGVYLCPQMPSRVVADLPYVLYSIAIMLLCISIQFLTWIVLPHVPPSDIAHGASSNMLLTFLFCNVITGIINLSFNTVSIGNAISFIILLIYSILISAFTRRADVNNFSLVSLLCLSHVYSIKRAEEKKERRVFASQICLEELERFSLEYCKQDKNKIFSSLNPQEQAIWNSNPHVRQSLVCKRPIFQTNSELSEHDRKANDPQGILISKFLNSTSLSTSQQQQQQQQCQYQYQRRIGEVKTVEHWGQRKLFISELEFLTQNAQIGDNVLYLGGAPGLHTNFLSSLFKGVWFWLYDPDPFYAWDELGSVSVLQELFTDELAEKWKGNASLLISDIRTPPKGEEGKNKMHGHIEDSTVLKDMKLQLNWAKIIKPRTAMLKFRLPYNNENGIRTTEYFDGDLYLPVWGGRTTTECRLVVSNPSENSQMKIYDNQQHSDSMFVFNTLCRTSLFNHSIEGVKGLDHCFDCSSEIHVVKKYLSSPSWNKTGFQPNSEGIAQMINLISTSIGETRHSLFVF